MTEQREHTSCLFTHSNNYVWAQNVDYTCQERSTYSNFCSGRRSIGKQVSGDMGMKWESIPKGWQRMACAEVLPDNGGRTFRAHTGDG